MSVRCGLIVSVLIAAPGCGNDVVTSSSGGSGGEGGAAAGGGGAGACPPPPCAAGTCQAETLVPPSGHIGIRGPVATTDYVYWAETEQEPIERWELYQVPRCGGDARMVAHGEPAIIWPMTAHGPDLYISVRFGPNTVDPPQFVQRISDSGSVYDMPGETNTRSFYATSSVLYWLGSVGGPGLNGAHRTSLPDLDVSTHYEDPDRWLGIRADDTHLFWGGLGGVRRARIDDPTGFDVVMPVEETGEVELVGDWLVAYEIAGEDDQEVWASRKDGSDRQLLFAEYMYPHFDTDGQHVYVRTFDFLVEDDVEIHRISPDTASDEVVFRGRLDGQFDVDGGWLYAYTVDQGVVRIPLPSE